MNSKLLKRFDEIEQLAISKGLDFFPIIFEEVPREVIWEVASYGLPTRMSHWSFGRSYLHQKTNGEMGFGRIYELIINNDPSYAFLDDTNPDIVNMLVAAHCYGHSHYFKNNMLFQKTNRSMVNQAESNAKTIEGYKSKYGVDVVEEWMDIAFALDKHMDTNIGEERGRYPEPKHVFREIQPLPYADLMGESTKPRIIEEVQNKAFPPHPEKELPADPALLAKLPLLVDAVVYDDTALAAQAERLRTALRRLAAAEGFTVLRARPKGPSILLQTSVQWSAATGLADQHLFLGLVIDQDGERVDEVSLQQTEGFPAQAAELDALLAPLVRQLARSPRLRERVKSLP